MYGRATITGAARSRLAQRRGTQVATKRETAIADWQTAAGDAKQRGQQDCADVIARKADALRHAIADHDAAQSA